jgi:hypothetical protein
MVTYDSKCYLTRYSALSYTKKPKIILHIAEEMFPSLKESQRYTYLPKLAQGHYSENCGTHPHHAYEAVITNNMEMKDTE